ncbi:O-unit flippase-like protein [Massilia sp. BSC265]|uniref:O-unit flippase-like protein n=1 Tax=Massilia sp. BSC265 TaxID=1549812 RepID=UPI0004E86786|nr:O-unit flippase-like protein [Massilia sp. BSC265]KFI08776.1 hypothetical protein JN27_01065 [Massilia sp. BSC265]
MGRQITQGDMIWGYVAQALNLGGGLLLLPISARYLSPEDLGLWFVFTALAGLAQLLELGFQPTFARNAAYVYSGAQQLAKTGLPARANQESGTNVVLLASLLEAARTVYRAVAGLAGVFMLLLGSLYIKTLLTPNQDAAHSLLAWGMFSLGSIINFYFAYINGFLQGRGDVTQWSKVTVFTRGSLVLFSVSALLMGYGLFGLGIASLLSAAVGRATAHHYFTKDALIERMRNTEITAEGKREILRTLWHNAGRLGVVQIGAFLIQRGNVLIAASFVGLAASGSYGITVTVLMALSGMASVVCQLQLPHLASLQASYNRKAAAEVLGETFLMSWVFFLLGLTFVVVAGDGLLTLIGSRNHLLPWPLCLMLGIVMLLEMNHSIAASYLTTLNKVPFVGAAIFSGIGVTLLTLLLIKPFGIAGIVIAQGAVQLAYNNWKWPLEAVKHLEVSLSNILVLGAKRIVSRYV